jgi:copper(I)-binding protein
MIKTNSKALLAVLALAALALAGCGETTSHNSVTISDPWARVTTENQTMGAAYMKIESESADKLIKAEVDPSIAGHAELHKAMMAEGDKMGKMTMKQVTSIAVPAELKPGGFHVMLIDLKKPIVKGEKVELTLTFEHAGEKTVTAVAKD